MKPNKRKFPIPNIIYSIASKGAEHIWFNKPFATGKNKEILDKIKRSLS